MHRVTQRRTPAASPVSRNRAPVTGLLLATLFALLGVLGLQGVPATASTGVPTPITASVHHDPAPAGASQGGPSVTPAADSADPLSSVGDTCAGACGQPPRAGRAAPGEWHAPSPGAVAVPPSFVVPLPEAGPSLSASPGAFEPPQRSARHSGRSPPSSTGI